MAKFCRAYFTSLQCGHGSDAVETPLAGHESLPAVQGFNAATAVTPWRHWTVEAIKADLRTLQCGHGSDAVETR